MKLAAYHNANGAGEKKGYEDSLDEGKDRPHGRKKVEGQRTSAGEQAEVADNYSDPMTLAEDLVFHRTQTFRFKDVKSEEVQTMVQGIVAEVLASKARVSEFEKNSLDMKTGQCKQAVGDLEATETEESKIGNSSFITETAAQAPSDRFVLPYRDYSDVYGFYYGYPMKQAFLHPDPNGWDAL